MVYGKHIKSRRGGVLCVALCTALVALPTFSDESADYAHQIDELFAVYNEPGSPGCAVSVMRSGEVVFKGAYGLASIESDVPIAPSTVFHVASVSKQFTTFAIVLLEQQGLLSLDDDIRKFIPEMHDFGETITIRHLINHTSGLRDQWSLLVMAGWRLEDIITMDDIMELVLRQRELNFAPGTQHIYCNSGYTLLGLIVERVSGLSLKAFCAERIFKPLGMASTHFHDDHRHIVKNRAFSYGSADGGFESIALSYSNVGATSLFTTVEDLARWDENFYSGRVGGMPAIETMYEPGRFRGGKTNSYGMALVHEKYRGLKTVVHGGADAGYRSYLLRFPEEELTVVVLSNVASFNSGGSAHAVAEIFLADRLEDVAAPVAIEEKPEAGLGEELTRFEGIYTWPRGGWAWRVRATDDGLIVSDVGTEGNHWVPVGGGAFEYADIERGTRLVFEENRKGVVGAEFISENEWSARLTKAEPRDTSEAYMSEIAGDYYSEELDVRYRIILKDSKLTLVRRKYGELRMAQACRDAFSVNTMYGVVQYHFTRDARGRVDGMRVSSGRVKGLRFDKVD